MYQLVNFRSIKANPVSFVNVIYFISGTWHNYCNLYSCYLDPLRKYRSISILSWLRTVYVFGRGYKRHLNPWRVARWIYDGWFLLLIFGMFRSMLKEGGEILFNFFMENRGKYNASEFHMVFIISKSVEGHGIHVF
jgi:hypothetical protein